jgi:hypothetical protein
VSSDTSAYRSKFGAVDEVMNDRQLTPIEKRSILASWASDAHAVADMPALRGLDDGKVVNIDEILDALKSIDGSDQPTTQIRAVSHRRQPFQRREPRIGKRWLSRIARRKNSDDDDPPPCPAAVAVPGRQSLVDARAPRPAWEPGMRCTVLAAA